MKYIASVAGVSQPTVSKVLNGRYVDIKKSTRERVLEVVKRLNYRPNYTASALRSGKRRCIGVAGNASLGEMSDPYASRIYAGIGSVAARHGDTVTFFPASLDADNNEIVKASHSGMVDGLIIILYSRQYTNFLTTTLPHLVRGQVPFTVIHFTGRELPCDAIGFDAIAGAERATQHLLDKGYRNIAVVRDSREQGSNYYEGCKNILDKVNRPLRDIVLPVAYRSDTEYVQEYERIIKNQPSIDGYVTISYQSAYGLVEALRKIGKRVPGDIGVVAGSNPAKRSMFSLDITAIDEQYEERGRAATEMIFEKIGLPMSTDDSFRKQILLPELIERKSTKHY